MSNIFDSPSKISLFVFRRNWSIALRASIVGTLLLSFTVIFFCIENSINTLDSIVSGINTRIGNLISVGDTFQIQRELNSLVIGGNADAVFFREKNQDHILIKSEKKGLIIPTDLFTRRFLFSNAKIYYLKTFPITLNDREVGYLDVFFPILSANVFVYLILVATTWLLCLAYISSKFAKTTSMIVQEIERFTNSVKYADDSETIISKCDSEWMFVEFSNLSADFSELLGRLKKYGNQEIIFEKAKTQVEISQQVSHDIRSPLAALEMISGSIDSLPEEKRVLIRSSINRIRDIANSLVRLEQRNSFAEASLLDSFKGVLLSEAIDYVVTESRFQYRSKIGTRIEFIQSKESYGVFVDVDVNEFKRVMSNLINNSVESLRDGNGVVEIKVVDTDSKYAKISVNDSGRGIPDSILEKVTGRGFSHGKKNGSGLGLYHAKKFVAEAKGEMFISSTINSGTKVDISLVRSDVPKWFSSKILVPKNCSVIVFDDDQSIHQIWKGRFESLKAADYGVKLLHLSSPKDLRQYCNESYLESTSCLFLVDYEIIGSKATGLELIQELGIASESVLVTSRYDEVPLKTACEYLGISMIPKSISGFVPIEFLI